MAHRHTHSQHNGSGTSVADLAKSSQQTFESTCKISNDLLANWLNRIYIFIVHNHFTFMRSFVVQPANKLRLFLCGYNVLFILMLNHSLILSASISFQIHFYCHYQFSLALFRERTVCLYVGIYLCCLFFLYKFAHQIAMIGTKEWRNWMNFSTVITTHYLEPIVSVFFFLCLSTSEYIYICLRMYRLY